MKNKEEKFKPKPPSAKSNVKHNESKGEGRGTERRWNLGEHNDGRGKLGYIQPPKLRRCNNCGYEAIYRSNSHKVWCKKTRKNIHCGTMRVIR